MPNSDQMKKKHLKLHFRNGKFDNLHEQCENDFQGKLSSIDKIAIK